VTHPGEQSRRSAPHPDFDREDYRALIETRRELGAEMEPALIDSFVTRIEEAAQQRARAQYEIELRRNAALGKGRGAQLALAIISVIMAIPLTAITASMLGLPGVLVTWSGIVLVNLALALRRPPRP